MGEKTKTNLARRVSIAYTAIAIALLLLITVGVMSRSALSTIKEQHKRQHGLRRGQLAKFA